MIWVCRDVQVFFGPGATNTTSLRVPFLVPDRRFFFGNEWVDYEKRSPVTRNRSGAPPDCVGFSNVSELVWTGWEQMFKKWHSRDGITIYVVLILENSGHHLYDHRYLSLPITSPPFHQSHVPTH